MMPRTRGKSYNVNIQTRIRLLMNKLGEFSDQVIIICGGGGSRFPTCRLFLTTPSELIEET